MNYVERIVFKWMEEKADFFYDYELYKYGYEVLMRIFMVMIVLLSICFALNIIPESLFAAFALFLLRTKTGGFHFSSRVVCTVISVATVVGIVIFSKAIPVSLLVYISIALFGLGIILSLAPVENSKKPIKEIDRFYYRKQAIILYCLFFIIGLIVLHTDLITIASIIAYVFLVNTLSIIATSTKPIKQY